MQSFQLADAIVIGGYFLLMIGIGLFSRKRTRNQEEYFMGGRKFGKIIQTFAEVLKHNHPRNQPFPHLPERPVKTESDYVVPVF